MQETLIDGNLQGEWLPLQTWSEVEKMMELKNQPCIYVDSLEKMVTGLLDEYDELGVLTWHRGGIPDKEIWIKIGGDKGGDSFKLMVQVANVPSPNSLRNTQIVSLFPAQDNSFNLTVGLSQVVDQVQRLQETSWRGKQIRVFLFGDYDFYTKSYGLSGASGRHCCLFCEISKGDMAIPLSKRGFQTTRTLETLAAHLQQFQSTNIAKEACNVIRPPLLQIPLDQVCPPGLHLSLGLFLKHFRSFEASCHQLDVKCAANLSQQGSSGEWGPSFQKEIEKNKLLLKLAELKSEKEDLLEQHQLMSILYPNTQPLDLLSQEAADKGEEITKLEEEAQSIPNLKEGQGPIAQSIEKTLQDLRVTRQAYHGRSFVGNHIHKCLQETNIDKLTEAVVQRTLEICPELVEEARALALKYNVLFRHYSKCDNLFNRADFISNEDIAHLDNEIKAYLQFYRANFPTETVPPKMHLVEDHLIPWLKKWRAGLGLMGEQGGEGMHVLLNNILHNMRGFHDDMKIQLYSVKSQWAHSNPAAYFKNCYKGNK